MKSSIYRYNGKLFRYDYEFSVVEYLVRATKDMYKDNEEWQDTYGRNLFQIDPDGYMVNATVGLHLDNWRRKSIRDEYLYEWCCELDEEMRYLSAEFI